MANSQRRAFSHEVENAFRTIVKRCVECPDTTPTCPKCPSNKICSLIPADCAQCAHMTCIANPSPPPKSSGPNVGAIAGGVIGGVVAVAVIVFLVWRFWIKKRREQQELEIDDWEGDDVAQQKSVHRFNNMHSDAVSTRTRGSVAHSFLSRASNIIQIAYIPGVTNRNGSGRDSLLDSSPVPPIPANLRGNNNQSQRSPLANDGDALFFRPGDLRDSTYSGTSSFRSVGNRDTQYTRQSITPSLARSSMASEIYRDDATTEPMPATTVTRAAPRMVSVKGSQGSSPTESPTASQGGFQVMVPGEGQSGTNSNTLRGKATQVTVGKGRFPVRQTSDATTASRHMPNVSSPLAEADEEEDDEDEHARARQSFPSAQPAESPFYDATEYSSEDQANPYASMGATIGTDDGTKRAGKGMGGLSAVIEEATRHASSSTFQTAGSNNKRNSSPFGDRHATE